MEEERAYTLALRYLSRFNVPRKKLINYLEKKGFELNLAAKVAFLLESQGYLNDFDYARAFVQRKKEKLGSFRLYGELIKKGIPREIANKAIREVSEEEERRTIKQLASDYLKRNTGLGGKIIVRKLAGFLTRRGFSQELVLAVIKEVLGDIDFLEAK